MNHVVFVPTLVDADNLTAQVGKVRAILEGRNLPGWRSAARLALSQSAVSSR
jgi:hypothetical protein